MSVTHLFPLPETLPRLANAEDVQVYWPVIRAALQGIKKEQGPRATWTSAHVLAAIRAGQAELWLVTNKTCDLDAFVVTQTIIDPSLHVPHGLFVWHIWRAPHTPKQLLVDLMNGFFIDLVKQRGLEYLEGVTTWKGLAESMSTRGWETVGFIIRRQVEEP